MKRFSSSNIFMKTGRTVIILCVVFLKSNHGINQEISLDTQDAGIAYSTFNIEDENSGDFQDKSISKKENDDEIKKYNEHNPRVRTNSIVNIEPTLFQKDNVPEHIYSSDSHKMAFIEKSDCVGIGKEAIQKHVHSSKLEKEVDNGKDEKKESIRSRQEGFSEHIMKLKRQIDALHQQYLDQISYYELLEENRLKNEISTLSHSEVLDKSNKNNKKTTESSNDLFNKNAPMSNEHRNELKNNARNMFMHAYTGYVDFALPHGELDPLSCQGRAFESCQIPFVTLIDLLDTLVVMGYYDEFKCAIAKICSQLTFDIDVNVSVFETNIRVLGGLLSAHLLATDPKLGIFHSNSMENHITLENPEILKGCSMNVYRNELLNLAVDLGDRLLPAFETPTGIPYGTVNLKYGVPFDETHESSLAGSGSLTLEFSTLSALTGDYRYRDAAEKAVFTLQKSATAVNLLGRHIDIFTGIWTENTAGLGQNSDSFYEYQLKMYELWGEKAYWNIFIKNLASIQRYLRAGDWFLEANILNGEERNSMVESLAAFWPGIMTSIGNTPSAAGMLNLFYKVWNHFSLLPEMSNIPTWRMISSIGISYALLRHRGKVTDRSSAYLLRPEVIESTYIQFRATKDSHWLWAGQAMMQSIEKFCRTACGYSGVTNVSTMELDGSMPSYFLAETMKYLFLLFDEDNFVHSDRYIFTTEAHLLNIRAIRSGGHANATYHKRNISSSTDRDFLKSSNATVFDKMKDNFEKSQYFQYPSQICRSEESFLPFQLECLLMVSYERLQCPKLPLGAQILLPESCINAVLFNTTLHSYS